MVLRGFRSEGIQVQHIDEPEGDGSTMTVLLQDEKGSSVRAIVDAVSKRLVGLSYTSMSMSSPMRVTEKLSDFRDVSGCVLPFLRTVVDAAGEVRRETAISEIEINPEIEEGFFSQPKE